MRTPRLMQKGFTLIELLVVIAIIAILAALTLPQLQNAIVQAQLTSSVSAARQIYLGAFAMAQDSSQGWPGDLAVQADPVTSLPKYVERMVENDFMHRGDLKIFAAPGVQPYPGSGPFESRYSAFKVYKVRESDVASCLFLATKNFDFDSGLSANTQPYSSKGAVILRRGGDGMKVSRHQATTKSMLGLMPGSTSSSDPGSEAGNVLAD